MVDESEDDDQESVMQTQLPPVVSDRQENKQAEAGEDDRAGDEQHRGAILVKERNQSWRQHHQAGQGNQEPEDSLYRGQAHFPGGTWMRLHPK